MFHGGWGGVNPSHTTLVGGGSTRGGAAFGRIRIPKTIPTTTPMNVPMTCVTTNLFIAHCTASVQLNAPAGTGGVYQYAIIFGPSQVERSPKISAQISVVVVTRLMRGTLSTFIARQGPSGSEAGIALTSLYPPFKVRRFRRAAVEDLILNVDALEEANQPFEADLPREFLDGILRADPPTEFHAGGAAHLRGAATKMGRKVLVQTRFHVPLMGPCKRCLTPVRLEEPVELTRTYAPKEPAHAPGERRGDDPGASFDPGLVDEDRYSGKEIDLTPAVREQILLYIPPAPLCREDCLGLCPKCGKDLNEGACGCDRSVIDPRWAALKGIQLQKKEK